MRVSSITKNAGKACNNRLYRHIRTFEKIIKNYFVIFHTFTKSAEFKEPPTEEEVMEAKQAEAQLREEQLVVGADENSEVNAESDNETQVVPNISEDDNIVDNAGNTMKDTQHSVALETEKKVLEEMFELEKKHFGESKKAVKIDVSL